MSFFNHFIYLIQRNFFLILERRLPNPIIVWIRVLVIMRVCFYKQRRCICNKKTLLKINIPKYEKRLLLRRIHHFESDWINNMDHMRISGIEPSSVSLAKQCYLKSWKSDGQKVDKQADAKMNGVINPQN